MRSLDLQVAASYSPLSLVIINVFYALFAYPAGAIADRHGKSLVFFLSLVAAVAAYASAYWWGNWFAFAIGLIFWGVHQAMSQGVLSAMVAELAPADLRGSVFGVYHLIVGISSIVSSVFAGLIWQMQGGRVVFLLYGSITCMIFAFWLTIRYFRIFKTK